MKCGLYRLMSSATDINHFGGSAWVGGKINIPYDNIESIHDDIHIAVGGNATRPNEGKGTMWYINAASFDPIFWMHHAMVDRMLGMWQVLHPNSWYEAHNGTNTFTISPDMLVDGSTPLMPFFMDMDGTPWTADASRSIGTFCYSYPDLDSSTSTAQVSTTLNNLYGQGCLINPSSSPAPRSSPRRAANNKLSSRNTGRADMNTLADISQSISNLLTNTSAMRDYVTNIRVDSMAVGSSFKVYIFDGPVSADSTTWDASPHLLGQRFFMTSGMKTMSRQLHKGSISISAALRSRALSGALSGMGNNEVTDYLRDNMGWKVLMVGSSGSIKYSTAGSLILLRPMALRCPMKKCLVCRLPL